MLISCITSDPELLVKLCQRNPKIFANVRKFWLISRYFLVFQVISRLWHIETFSFLHSMFISCITSDPELLVKFCQRNPKIIANVRTIYSAYKMYTKVQLMSLLCYVNCLLDVKFSRGEDVRMGRTSANGS